MILFSTFILSAVITTVLMPLFINMAGKVKLVDVPDARKVHARPMPRVGGVVMALAAFIPVVVWAPKNELVLSIIMGATVMVMLGLADDLKNLDYKAKFAGQIIAALIVILYGGVRIDIFGKVLFGGYVLPLWLSVPVTLVVIVGVTNAINMSDGLDGLAGGMSLMNFLFIGYLAYNANFQAVEVISIAMVGAIFGLLRYNTHPAVVFMGDAGSQMLGFLIITLALTVTQKTLLYSPMLPLLIVGIPLIDTASVILQRIRQHRSPFRPDKNHLHHKVMKIGFYHSESVFIIYVVHAFMIFSAFIFKYKYDWTILSLFFMFTIGVVLVIYTSLTYGWRFKRYPVIDKMVKGPLRRFRDEYKMIKLSFKAAEIGFCLLLIITCLLPRNVHIYLSLSASALLMMIFVSWCLKKEWTFGLVELSFFFLVPFIAYLSETDVSYLNQTVLKDAYTFSFGALVVLVLLTLKFTRRYGFRTNPFDFLIIFIALVIPNLPDEHIRHWQMGFVAAKIVVLYFTYEVLKGELRLEAKKLGFASIGALLIIGIRGLVG